MKGGELLSWALKKCEILVQKHVEDPYVGRTESAKTMGWGCKNNVKGIGREWKVCVRNVD